MRKTTKYFQPDEIVVFSKPYKFKYIDSLGDVDRTQQEFLYGEINFRESVIRMHVNSVAERDHYRIMCHELIHAIVNDLNVDFKNDDEEKIIDNIALGIADILVSNGLTKKLT